MEPDSKRGGKELVQIRMLGQPKGMTATFEIENKSDQPMYLYGYVPPHLSYEQQLPSPNSHHGESVNQTLPIDSSWICLQENGYSADLFQNEQDFTLLLDLYHTKPVGPGEIVPLTVEFEQAGTYQVWLTRQTEFELENQIGSWGKARSEIFTIGDS